MDLAFVLYPKLTALDLIGPYEVLAHQRDVTVRFVAATLDPVTADAGLIITPTATFDEVDRADVIVVPGSGAWPEPLADGAVARWLRKVHPTATWTTSVCTGSTLLAQAGILDGRPATTHWAVREELAQLGAVVSTDRVVRAGNVLTGAGVSAGIDMALTLVGLIWGDDRARFTQLLIEYAPEPPYDSGTPDTAPASVLAMMRAELGT
ncbi:DJ-1/PfpI family protein [Actinosynnema sp. NPDC047251]|uniref:4-methyl-5(B-hydroxyethyl)-thiazole monophosphate biosynthesis enzyme n=1 Tax=Saccharothrix espanaensis (strain ATCC 51144 / DSM 44229 / JCM 9112 / NBRC 15066 / NRRL 15764) TaxID=1179773 RepID=K0JZ28_SACES|nr:DJ-1/PfpI family protein [Saccharothrix espanaensis]CCH30517.1 4-methyl-5(B-hydroxyethyl)-thiazole monophosphate biosynthesis enzyme [Saccharothrix espanaensis DSM 44229]